MNTETKCLIEAIEDAGYTPQAYSGRGMCGRKCVGIELDSEDSQFKAALKIAAEYAGDLDRLLELSVKDDALGLGSIVYFPLVDWPEATS
jgi:hypothetical protein